MIGNDDVGVENLDDVMMPEPQESKSDCGEKYGVKELPDRDQPESKIFPRGDSGWWARTWIPSLT